MEILNVLLSSNGRAVARFRRGEEVEFVRFLFGDALDENGRGYHVLHPGAYERFRDVVYEPLTGLDVIGVPKCVKEKLRFVGCAKAYS